MMQPSFTIFIPTYNGEQYIKDCLESALNQTYPFYNIVILDSGSTDDTLNTIYSLAAGNGKVKVETSGSRLNIIENWDRIVNYPKNDWLTILGQDDILAPDFLAAISVLINKHSQSDLFRTHFCLIDENGQERRKCEPIPEIELADNFIKERFRMKRDSFATGYVIRAKEYERTGGIASYPDLLFADDALWVTLSLEKPVITSPDYLFYYRFHFKSTSGTPHQERLITAAEMYLNYLKKLANSYPSIMTAIKQNAHVQIKPLLKGYYGLALLHYSHLGLPVANACNEHISNICELSFTDVKEIKGDKRLEILQWINNSSFRKLWSGIIFNLLPSLKKKARF